MGRGQRAITDSLFATRSLTGDVEGVDARAFVVPPSVTVLLERWGGQPVRAYRDGTHEVILRVRSWAQTWGYHVELRAERRGVDISREGVAVLVRDWQRVGPGQRQPGVAGGTDEHPWKRWTVDRTKDHGADVLLTDTRPPSDDDRWQERAPIEMTDAQWRCLLADMHALSQDTLWPKLPTTPVDAPILARSDASIRTSDRERVYVDHGRKTRLSVQGDEHWLHLGGDLDPMRLARSEREEDLRLLRAVGPGGRRVGTPEEVRAAGWTIEWQRPDHAWTDGRVEIANPHAHPYGRRDPVGITPRVWRTVMADLELLADTPMQALPERFAPEPVRVAVPREGDLATHVLGTRA